MTKDQKPTRATMNKLVARYVRGATHYLNATGERAKETGQEYALVADVIAWALRAEEMLKEAKGETTHLIGCEFVDIPLEDEPICNCGTKEYLDRVDAVLQETPWREGE